MASLRWLAPSPGFVLRKCGGKKGGIIFLKIRVGGFYCLLDFDLFFLFSKFFRWRVCEVSFLLFAKFFSLEDVYFV